MSKPEIIINGKSLIVTESKRPKGFRVDYGSFKGSAYDAMEVLVAAVESAGHTIIRKDYNSSQLGPLPVVFFK